MTEFVVDFHGNDVDDYKVHERIVRCGDCVHSRIEKHTGDDKLTCWIRKSHGEVVDARHFCAKGVGE